MALRSRSMPVWLVMRPTRSPFSGAKLVLLQHINAVEHGRICGNRRLLCVVDDREADQERRDQRAWGEESSDGGHGTQETLGAAWFFPPLPIAARRVIHNT